MDAPPRFPVGCIHHATHLKQSPPLLSGLFGGAKDEQGPGRRLGDAFDFETGERQEMGHGPSGARLTVRLEAGDARAYRVEQIG